MPRLLPRLLLLVVLLGATAGCDPFGVDDDRRARGRVVLAAPDRERGVTARLFGITDRAAQRYLPVAGGTPVPGAPRQPGDRFLLRDALYALDEGGPAPQPVGAPVGELLSECTAILTGSTIPETTVRCTAVVRFFGLGTLSVAGGITFREMVDPGFVTLAVTGGTGAYAGADGELQITELDPSRPEQSLDSVYEVRL